MMCSLLFVCCILGLTTAAQGQPSQPICINPLVPSNPVEVLTDEFEQMEDLTNNAAQILSKKMSGKSFEDSVGNITEFLAETSYELLSIGLEQPQDYFDDVFVIEHADDVVLATWKALENTTSGTEVLQEFLNNDPKNFQAILDRLSQNFNSSCMDQPRDFFTIFSIHLFSELSCEQVPDIYSTASVENVKRTQQVSIYINALTQLIEKFDNNEGFWSFKNGSVTKNNEKALFIDTMRTFFDDVQGQTKLLLEFFDRVQEKCSLDDAQLVDFVVDMYANMLIDLEAISP